MKRGVGAGGEEPATGGQELPATSGQPAASGASSGPVVFNNGYSKIRSHGQYDIIEIHS